MESHTDDTASGARVLLNATAGAGNNWISIAVSIVVLIDAQLLQGCLGTDGVPSEQVLELLAHFGADYRVMR